MNKYLLVLAVLVLAVGTFFWVSGRGSKAEPDYKNATYEIEGQNVTMVNGKAEVETAAGSASKTVTQYFGNVGKGDLNGDT